MRLSVPLITLFLFASLITKSQNSTVNGVVTDAGNSRPLTGATIIVQKTNRTVTSDNDGNFKIANLPAGSYTITVSYVGYATKEIAGVEVVTNGPTTLNVSLDLSTGNKLNEVIVKTEARRENVSALLNVRRNSAVVSDFISADMIRRSPDKNTSDVLKRVSGTTIQDNKFVVVRGMNDRYNEALLNGALLPSSEPDRKTFAFDIFPSEILDNITVIKSASPDLPGSFAGGLIQVNTKEAPDKNFISVRGSLSYHTITTGKDYYDYKGGKTDWLGKDDGTRSLPKRFPSTKEFAKLDLTTQNDLGKRLENNWKYYLKSAAPLNYSFQAFGGFNANLSHKHPYPKLSGIMGVTYTTFLKYSHYKRYDYLDNGDTVYNFTDSAYNTSVLASGMANLSFKLNSNNKFFFNNLLSVNSNDQLILRSGPNQSSGYYDIKANSFFFTTNRITNTQLGGDHFFPKSKLRIRWQGYYTDLKRNEPDYRRNQYFQNEQGSPYYLLLGNSVNAGTSTGVHYYARVRDKTKGLNLDLSLPFKILNNTQTFKIGGTYYHDTRGRNARFFAPTFNPDIEPNFNFNLLSYSQDSVYAQKNFNARHGLLFTEYNDPKNHYDGFIKNTAAYVMLDDKLTKTLRLVWGLRMENYHQVVRTFDENNEHFTIDTTYLDFLPSANLIYSILPKANIRASFSKSVARPLYRELANQLFYDFLSNATFFGNPKLTETHITNFDVRWEQYFLNSQYYSVSFFYKKFKDPIEPYIAIASADSRTIGFTNLEDPFNPTTSAGSKAHNYGVELEFRKNFDFISQSLKNLSAYANVSFIKSKTNAYASSKDSTFRPLQGQSPYIINAALQYNEPKTNLGVSVLYNVIGPRLLVVGGLTEDPVYEKVHPALDIKLSKSFLKKGLAELTFSDILHKDDVQYWDLNNSTNHKYNDNGDDRLIQNNTYGMNVTVTVGYRF